MTPRLLRLAVLTAALVLGSTSSAAGQPAGGERADPPLSLPPNGSELFRGLFHYHKVKPIVPGQMLPPERYKDQIVVVLGLPPGGRKAVFNPGTITVQTLRRGGAVLIAVKDDLDLSGYFPDNCLIDVTGERVYCPDPNLTLGGRPGCPFVRPAEPGTREQLMMKFDQSAVPPEWSLFFSPRGGGLLRRVATNVPGALQVTQASTYASTELAVYPRPDYRVGGPKGPQLPSGRVFALAGAGTGNQLPYRCLVLADPSVFHNQMMVVPEDRDPNALGSDNLAFADNVVNWLKGPQQRSQCLFIEAGRIQDRFDVVDYGEQATPPVPPIPPIPVPPPPDLLNPGVQRALTDGINRRVAGWEDRNGHNRAVLGNPSDDRRFASVLRFLAVAAAVVVFLWLVRRVWAARQLPEVTPIPKDTGRVAASGAPGSLARRKEELLQSGQYADVLREYLQELFASRGLPLPVLKPAGKLPPVEITGRGATTIRDHLRILWEVAFGPNPQPVSYARWKELEPMLETVRRAADEGRWRFVGGSA